MGQSYRIRTELGVNKTINVQLDQDFEFLEILSLTIQQSDVYVRACADYGVIVGRVTANNGFGLPNARVSVFIPIEQVDESNPIISSIYPYKSPEDKNEDGYRYNLLPYEPSYTGHAASGTLPTRKDALTGSTAVQIYDKYYKFTSRTNESGDYMIMGVPTGTQQLVMDVDLSDIGEFSLSPQDLIRMGRATEAQVAGNRFRTSNDLNSLPQIVNLTKTVEVSPLWGDPDVCQIAINRVDFDLRDDVNIDIQPTAVFLGSVVSTQDSLRLRRNARPKDNMGNLCQLTTGPGQIIAIRQTNQQDSEGNPILEQYELPQAGNVIDGNGTWLLELPMNLDYFVTNEFGEKVLSNDPTIGIPTKSKYRFKIKWQQPATLTQQVRRPYYLVPNVKEYGWSNDQTDPNINTVSQTQLNKLSSSYYFGLEWSGYTNGFFGQEKIDRLNEAINCEDTFYQFEFNKVYTVSSLIDEFKNGGRGRFIGIKEIDSDDCAESVNKFPVNEGVRNFDFLFFLFSILMTVLQPTFMLVLVAAHFVLFIYNLIQDILCALSKICFLGICPFKWLQRLINCDNRNYTLRLPMLTYPDCQACDCKSDLSTSAANQIDTQNTQAGGVLTYVSLPETYLEKFQITFSADPNVNNWSILYSESLSGFAAIASKSDTSLYKIPLSQNLQINNRFTHTSSRELPLGERINIFNTRKNYFDGINKVKVKVEPAINIGNDKYHYDNTIVLLSNTPFNSGDLLTSVNLYNSSDVNYLYSANTIDGITNGISGSSYTTTAITQMEITYASSPTTSQTVLYTLPYGSNETQYRFPADIEYFQVVTAITWNDITKIWNPNKIQSFPNVLYEKTSITTWENLASIYIQTGTQEFTPVDMIADIPQQYVLVLQRGVDPYSPKYTQQYSLGNLFGTNDNDSNFIITTSTRLNIPIQVNSSQNTSVEGYSQNDMFYNSYFFKPGISGSTIVGEAFSAYTTNTTGYYGLQDTQNIISNYSQLSGDIITSKTSNGFYLQSPNSSQYDLSEDLSGIGIMGCSPYPYNVGTTHPSVNYQTNYFAYSYQSKTIFGGVEWSAMTISNSIKNILRTDRLPSSDQLDGGGWSINPALLQQNLNFNFYVVSTDYGVVSTPVVTTGAQQPDIDVEGLPDVGVLESFTCEKMVGLDCYQGFGSTFQVNEDCSTKDAVERGCYLFLRRPLFDILKDIDNLSEWAYRFRFFYGICRGVLSQSFTNNWVNGTLYMYPIQVDTFYDNQNRPEPPRFARQVIYFDSKTNNFYFRSSPWRGTVAQGNFIGRPTNSQSRPTNDRNLLSPTTVVNLGMKDSFYQEIIFDPSARAYIMKSLESSSYSDTSDLVNLFVISRITDENFLARLLSNLLPNNGLDQLFSRPKERIDGDLAQAMSINSEFGVIPFSPEYYESNGQPNPPVVIAGTPKNPAIGVFFSSTTEDLQNKDYISPGVIDFRPGNFLNAITYPYGIKSQVVPFYQWELQSTGIIFGSQLNNWKTSTSDIVSYPYQSLSRRLTSSPSYFSSGYNGFSDIYQRGYIFAVDQNQNYAVSQQQSGTFSPKFMVGAPYHFYFGLIKGESALDKFKTKYSVDE